jgi:hypothetical protein
MSTRRVQVYLQNQRRLSQKKPREPIPTRHLERSQIQYEGDRYPIEAPNRSTAVTRPIPPRRWSAAATGLSRTKGMAPDRGDNYRATDNSRVSYETGRNQVEASLRSRRKEGDSGLRSIMRRRQSGGQSEWSGDRRKEQRIVDAETLIWEQQGWRRQDRKASLSIMEENGREYFKARLTGRESTALDQYRITTSNRFDATRQAIYYSPSVLSSPTAPCFDRHSATSASTPAATSASTATSTFASGSASVPASHPSTLLQNHANCKLRPILKRSTTSDGIEYPRRLPSLYARQTESV